MSEFLVSARKYRPQKFDEVVGQDHVAKTLKNALKTGQLAHAFLFTGPRGVGKTTCARILAKVLNCMDLQNDSDPCNVCSSCNSFNNSASFNVFELDAASNNSVEHIRNLVDQVRIQPQQGKYKIFIIDEVHMLSSSAFNAFLKTLEEPPSYAVFILATTEKHKILPTILSRCQIFDFKRIQISNIVQQLQHIATKENTQIEEEALHLIAEKADGAMRDALSLYDKIVSSSSGDIGYKDVVTNLNILDYDYFFKITDCFIKEDVAQLFVIFNEILKNGFEPAQLVQGLAKHLRNLLMLQDPATSDLLNCSNNQKEKYAAQAAFTKSSFLLSALNLLNKADVQMPMAVNKSLHTEIALAKICYLNRAIEIPASNTHSAAAEKKKLVHS